MYQNFPYLRRAADVDSLGRTFNPTAGGSANVIGIDIQTDAIMRAGIDAAICRAAAQRFRQQHRRAAVQ